MNIITIAGTVGDNAYAAGYRVELAGKVGGDAMAAGYRVEISESGADIIDKSAQLADIRRKLLRREGLTPDIAMQGCDHLAGEFERKNPHQLYVSHHRHG